MKFGDVPVGEAEGAILAHSVKAGEKRLRKGQMLERAHIEMLGRAGIASVVIARLEVGDLHEDDAALAVAEALIAGAGPHVRLSQPGKGRVNVIAAGPGVVVMDEARLREVNRVNPMITVATVPPFQQMAEGGMIATVKIISYAVPGVDVSKAVESAHGALDLHGPEIARAALIITEIAGGAGDKGREAIAARLEALNVTLDAVVLVPHKAGELAQALEAELKTGKDGLVLILTGSATSDLGDIAPEAVRVAGGEIKRFGMPVDPGNLLFLGRLAERPVIGLPGCVRSPALNGADWVLSRVVCGIDVTHADIADMAVGGLLKEIPTRPMPRRGKRES
ncbi:molybdopterin-binding protein [Rhodobacteraceae bacterium LMO-12]|nr:molybdopterin-binding protein [Rhodobacteraceae bacterium LMO-JJ12]